MTLGIVLTVVTLALLGVARSASRPAVLPELLAAVNVAWAVGSFVVAATGWLELSTAGRVWAVAQGVVVLAFGLLQLRALRRA